jgi:hypothetical protein
VYVDHVHSWYTRRMEVPITQFRRDIFALANRALEGETITVAYKGKRLRIVPEIDPKTRFDRVTPLQIINPEFPNLEDVDMLPEMQREWEKDWEEQGLV